ncbi:hypothetical protein [Escherichia phage vB-Eco-KMB37]|nr:hypothetical protein [Escherichia phage vB-Eco-KMB37]
MAGDLGIEPSHHDFKGRCLPTRLISNKTKNHLKRTARV